METSPEHTFKKRVAAAFLLFFSCVIAVVLLWKVEPAELERLTTASQLDSLITQTLTDFGLPQSQIRTNSIRIDSLFTRNVYSIRVAPQFSKTTFHYHLYQELLPYKAKTVGEVQFPDRDLRIHILVNNTIHRTVNLQTDPVLQTQH